MTKYSITIPGEPMGKQRPRSAKYGVYTPTKTADYETLVKQTYMSEIRQKLNGQLRVSMSAYFKIPQSTGTKKRLLMLSGDIRPTKTPDCDNIMKIILDSLNSIAYDDDRQVVSAAIDKYYSDTPRVEVIISEIK